MSDVELQQQLDNANKMLKVANAKHAAANHSLGVALGEANDVKAANILYQENEKELLSKVQELQFKIVALEKHIVELEKELSELKKPKDESPVTMEIHDEVPQVDLLAQEQIEGDHFEL